MNNFNFYKYFKKLILFAAILSLFASAVYGAGAETSSAAGFAGLIQAYYDEWESDATYTQLEGFAVTGGLPATGDNTFGFERAIKGIAPKDTVITISIFMFDEGKAEFYPINTVTLDPVGASEFFDKTVSLDNGDNYIIITASRNSAHALASSIIKCKDYGIKLMLEDRIAFPGQWVNAEDEETVGITGENND